MATNGYDGDELKRFIKGIDRQHDELDRLKSEYMTKCQGPRGKIKETMKAVREAEINVPAFRVELKHHLDARKHDKRVAALEDDDAEAYDLIVDALGDYGDTPLGKAAIARTKKKGESLDSLKQ